MRNFISVVLLFILIPVTLLMLFAVSFMNAVLTPEFIKGELVRRQLYTIAHDEIGAQLRTLTFDSSLPLKGSDVEKLFQRVIAVEWMEQNFTSVLDATFAWFNEPLDMHLSLPVDLRSPKKEFVPVLDALIGEKISQLPQCNNTPGQGFCRTTDLTVVSLKTMLQSQGVDPASLVAQLPDTMELTDPVLPPQLLGGADTALEKQKAIHEQVQSVLEQMQQVKIQYMRALRYYHYALLVFVVLILCFLALNAKNLHRFVAWTGILALATSILPLIAGIGSKPVIERVILPQLQFDPTISKEIVAVVPLLIGDLGQALFMPLLIAGIVLLVVGVAFLVWARSITRGI